MCGILGLLRPVVVALIASAGLTVLILSLWGEGGFALVWPDLTGLALFAVSLFALRKWKPGPIAVILGCGVVGLAVEFIRRILDLRGAG